MRLFHKRWLWVLLFIANSVCAICGYINGQYLLALINAFVAGHVMGMIVFASLSIHQSELIDEMLDSLKEAADILEKITQPPIKK